MNIKKLIENTELFYEESERQNDLFTENHTKFDCELDFPNGQFMCFTYQCNLDSCSPNVKDCLYSLILDADLYDSCMNINDFAEYFDLNNMTFSEILERVTKMYEDCKSTSQQIHSIFTDKEFEELFEYFSQC